MLRVRLIAGTLLGMSEHRPLIGLTGRPAIGAGVSGMPRAFGDLDVDVYLGVYAAAVASAGGAPVHLPLSADMSVYGGKLDAVLLVGGADVAPARYGAEAAPETQVPEPRRDAAEFALLDMATADQLPVLGICRGLQVLNVYGGGTLHQHLPAHARYDQPAGAVDVVTFEPGSRLHGIYGDTTGINSLHHQAVDQLADGFRVAGRGSDGVIEAIEHHDRDLLAVQWHPEILPTAGKDPVFRWLVDAAMRRRGAESPRSFSSN